MELKKVETTGSPGKFQLLDALNKAAMALQKASHDEAEVIRVFSDQIGQLGLRGGFGRLNESGSQLTIKRIFQDNKVHSLQKRLEKLVGLRAEGFSFDVDRVDVYRQVVRKGETVYAPDSSLVIAQLIPGPAKAFAGRILKTFGSTPGIFAPLTEDGRVIGTLNIAGASLTIKDVPAVRALADHFSIALENAALFQRLSASEDRYRDLVEHSQDLICTHDLEGNVLSANPQAAKMLGYGQDELLKMKIQDILAPEFRDQFDAYISTIIEQGADRGILQVQTRSGETRIWEFNNTLRTEGVAQPRVRGMARDITERKQAEHTLQANQKKIQHLFDQQVAVNQLALALGETLDLGDVYHTIYEHIRTLADAWVFIVSSYDDQTRLIQAEYVVNGGQVLNVANFPSIPLGESGQGTQSQVIHSGQPLYTPDHRRAIETSKKRYVIEKDGSIQAESPSEKDKEDTTRSALYVPMKVKGKITGVMQMQSTRLDAYSQEDIDLLAGMANVAALGVQNARLHAKVTEDLIERKQAVEILRNSEASLRKAQQVAHVGSWIWYVLENRLEWSDEMYQIFGIDKEVFTGKLSDVVASAIHPDDRAAVEQSNMSVSEDNKPIPLEYRVVRPDGTMRTVWAEAGELIFDDAGQAIKLTGIVQDITERKHMQESLRESEARLLGIFNTALDAIVTIDDTHCITAFNPSAEQMFGFPASAALGQPLDIIIPESHRQNHAQLVLQFGKAGASQRSIHTPSIELTCLRRDGELFPSEISISRYEVDHRNYYTAIIRDITERKRYEMALQESEERFRSLYENATIGIYRTTPDGRILMVNPAAVRMLGYERFEELAARDLEQQGYEPSYSRRDFRQRLETDRVVTGLESAWFRKDGSVIWVRESAREIRDEGGNLLFYDGTFEDITEQKRAEQALHQEKDKAQIYLDIAGVIIVAINTEREVTLINHKGCEILGYEQDQIVGRSWIDNFLPTSNRDQTRTIFNKMMAGDVESVEYHENPIVTKSGEERIIAWHNAILKDDDGNVTGTLSSGEDITERKQAELALRESEDKLRNIIQHSSSMFYAHTPDNILTYVSPQSRHILDCEPEEAMVVWQEFLSDNPANLPGIEATERALQTGQQQPPYELELITRKGRKIWVWVDESPVVQNGEIISMVGSINDITKEKQAEEELEASERRFRDLFHALPAICFTFDRQGVIHHWNRASEALFGWTAEQAIGKSMFELMVLEKNAGQTRENIKAVFEGQSFEGLEFEDVKADGSRCIVLASEYPLRDSQGQVVFGVCAELDITERVRTRDELRRSALQFETLFEMARDLAGEQNLPDLLNIILARTQELFQAQACGIYLYDVERDDLEMVATTGVEFPVGIRLQVGEGVAGRVAQTREPLIIEDYQNWEGLSPQFKGVPFTSVLEVPMIYAGGLIGVLVVSELAPKTRKFDQADILQLSLIAASAAGAVHSARLYETEKKRAGELYRLYRASGALLANANPDLNQLSETIVKTILREFKQSNCSLVLVQPGTQKLWRAAAAGPYTREVQAGELRLDGPGMVPQAIRSGKIINAPDVRESAEYLPNWSEARSELTVPLKIGGRILGAIDVQSTAVGAFSRDDERLMAIFAERAALALENTRLFEEANRRLDRLASLRKIDQAISSNLEIRVTLEILLGQVRQQLDVDAAAVLLYKVERQILEFAAGQGFRTQTLQSTSLHLGQGFAGRVASERQIIQVSDIQTLETGFLQSPEFRREQFVAYIGVPLIAKGAVFGVLEIYQRQQLNADPEWLAFLKTLAGQAAIAIDNAELFNNLERSNTELINAYDATIEGWAKTLELRDQETEGHSQRVVEMTITLASAMGLTAEEIVNARRGALLHDIGKMGIPDSILQKTGPLNDDEWVIMKQHPVFAYNSLSGISFLESALDIPYSHHEKWNGSGYPNGLKGEEIPLTARLFAIIDVFDALSSDRPYRKAWPEEKIIAYLKEESGKHFDPQVVEAFLALNLHL